MARQSDSWLAEQLGKPYRLVGLIGAAAILSAGALFGLAASVGLQEVWQKLVFPHWYWLPIAVAGLLVAYLGYTIAYREVVRAERGPELDVPSVAALVATGFGVFIQGGSQNNRVGTDGSSRAAGSRSTGRRSSAQGCRSARRGSVSSGWGRWSTRCLPRRRSSPRRFSSPRTADRSTRA